MISRRGFLKFLGMAPAVPAVAALPVSPAPSAVEQVKAQAEMQVAQVGYEIDDYFSHYTTFSLAGKGELIYYQPSGGDWIVARYEPPL